MFSLALFPFQVNIVAARLHDTGRSGKLQFLYLIPIVGVLTVLVLCALPSDLGDNRWDTKPVRRQKAALATADW